MTNIEGLDSNVVEDKSSVESANTPDIASDLISRRSGSPDIASDISKVRINRHIENTISSKLALSGDVKQEDMDSGKSIFQKFWYYANDMDKGFTLGHAKAVESAGKFIFDIAGVNEDDNARKMLSNFMKRTNDELAPKTFTGNASEIAGQVITGMAFTGGLNPLGASSGLARVGANSLQGGIIDGVFFDEKSGNIADFLKDLGADNAVVDYLSSKDDEDSSRARFKNALTGMGIGVVAESIFGLFALGKSFKKGDEVLKDTINPNVDNLIETQVTKEAIPTQTPQQLIEEHFEIVKNEAKKSSESIPIEQKIEKLDTGATSAIKNTGGDLVKQAEDIINGVKPSPNEVPLVNPKHLEVSTGTKELDDVLIALRGIEKDTPYRSQKDAMELAEKTLRDAMKDPNFSADKFVEGIANQVKYQDVKTGMMKTALSLVTRDFQSKAQKAFMNPESVSSLLELTNSLEKFNRVTSHFSNYTGNIARAMSMLNYNTANKSLVEFFKVLDTIDAEQSYMIFKKALDDGKIGQDVIDNLYGVLNKADNLKSVIDNYQDGWMTKTMNVISESGIASMISGIPTMVIGVAGNAITRSIDFGIDMNRYVLSNVFNTATKMQTREAKALLVSHTYKSVYDAKASLKLLKAWAYGDDSAKGIPKSFKDDDFDSNVLIRMYQDQPTHHKYVSAKYIRGEEKGTESSAINTMIDIYGKVARSPYKIPSVIDDIAKRGAFRTELIRQASVLADIRKIPDDSYGKFIDDFVRANTELQLMKNNYGKGFRPKKEWIEANKNFIGTGDGFTKYADMGADKANYLAFQEEFSGNMEKTLEILNSNGFLRILYPFKTITLNSLDMAGETTMPFLYKRWQGELKAGGVKRDIALAKLAMSGELLFGTYSLLDSDAVMVTGTYDPREAKGYADAGYPSNSLSMDGGKTWHDYRQYEPLSTILSTFTDLKNLYRRVQNQKEFVPKEEIDSMYSDAMKDLLMLTANNIANKTFAKNLSDQIGVLFGTKSATDWAGNTISGLMPFSGLAQSTGRVVGDGTKYEPATFTDRIFKSYRWVLDRPDLDAFGMEMDDIKYTPILSKKVDTSDPKFESRKEMVRLGVMPEWKVANISVSGVNVRLTGDEKYMANKLLNSDEIAYQDNMDSIINSDSYKSSSDVIRAEMLSKAKSMIIHNATELLKSKLQDRILDKASLKIQEIERGTVDAKYSSIVKGITDGK